MLEHLRFPERLLARLPAAWSSRNGLLLVSVPNVANVTVRLSLLFGRFNYRPARHPGQNARALLHPPHGPATAADNGYEIAAEKTTVMPVELALGLSARNPLMRLANMVLFLLTLLLPGLFGYQCVYAARPRQTEQA